MNDTLEAYNSLQILKRIDEKYLRTYYNLQSRIDKGSKNRLIICKSKKDCREAIKFIAKDYLDRAEINMSDLKIKIDDITLIFMPVSEIDYYLTGYRYKKYYFEDEFHL